MRGLIRGVTVWRSPVLAHGAVGLGGHLVLDFLQARQRSRRAQQGIEPVRRACLVTGRIDSGRPAVSSCRWPALVMKDLLCR
jgi:hypothetical protein